MGMFSWRCKGCGHELKGGEYVRLNGCVGEYDGYGRAGGFEYQENSPSAWHVRCYDKATVEQKLNDDPSKHAPNQGFGFAALENMKGYDSEAKTTFQPVVYVDHYDWKTEKTTRQQWYVVDGVLVDQYHYDKLYEAGNCDGIANHLWDEHADDWHKTASEEERFAFYEKVQKVIEDHIGMKRPRINAKWFDDFEESKRAVELLIPSLPNPEWGYELAIFGKQKKADGLFYKFNKLPNTDAIPIPGEFYPWGTKAQKCDYVFNGTFDEEVAYMHDRAATNGVKSY